MKARWWKNRKKRLPLPIPCKITTQPVQLRTEFIQFIDSLGCSRQTQPDCAEQAIHPVYHSAAARPGPGQNRLAASACTGDRRAVNIWLVAPETAANAPALQYLNQFASATGGKFLFFIEGSALPNPEEYVGRMRNVYRLRYTSAVSQSGTHSVRVAAKYGNLSSETPETQFSINLNLPVATLINLPPIINREYTEAPDGSGKVLEPEVITLQAAITFPDGFKRQLKAARLYVDGAVVAENTEEPFDYFGWRLDQYVFSGEHLVAVEAEDILGFRNISPPASVMINVASPYPSWLVGILKFPQSGRLDPISDCSSRRVHLCRNAPAQALDCFQKESVAIG